MQRWLVGLSLLSAVGCHKAEPTKVACETPPCNAATSEFDARWASAEKAIEPAFIEGEKHGPGLLGEVRRALDPVQEGKSPVASVTGQLPDGEVVKVIRANLGAVKACYAIEERSGTVGSGKAIVTLKIKESGTVDEVKVDAPAFRESHLPDCVSGRARSWTFPKFTEGPKQFSYPFVFVGG